MKSNVSSVDKVFRLLVLPVAILLVFTKQVSQPVGYGLVVAGVVLAATALVGFCPLYAIFRISTKKNAKRI